MYKDIKFKDIKDKFLQYLIDTGKYKEEGLKEIFKNKAIDKIINSIATPIKVAMRNRREINFTPKCNIKTIKPDLQKVKLIEIGKYMDNNETEIDDRLEFKKKQKYSI